MIVLQRLLVLAIYVAMANGFMHELAMVVDKKVNVL